MGARWYDPALGRFIQPDTIIPVAEQGIQAWDRMAYVNNNPIKYRDISGHCTSDDYACTNFLKNIEMIYKITVEDTKRQWNIDQLNGISYGTSLLQDKMGITKFAKEFTGVTFRIVEGELDKKTGQPASNMWTYKGDKDVNLAFGQNDFDFISFGTIHELAHIWDFNYDEALSQTLMYYTGGYEDKPPLDYQYYPEGATARDYGSTNPKEDWADSVAFVVYPKPTSLGYIENFEFFKDSRQAYVNMFLYPTDPNW